MVEAHQAMALTGLFPVRFQRGQLVVFQKTVGSTVHSRVDGG